MPFPFAASAIAASVIAASVFAAACGDETMVAAHGSDTRSLALTDVDRAALTSEIRAVAGKRVWFGHHSVGTDILEGVHALAREAGVELSVAEGPIGENGKPLEKIADFEREAIASQADLVAMKLCYADFTPTTDARSIVDAYAAAVQRIQKARPGVRVLHITPPLTVRQTDLKSRVRRLLGRPVWGDEANLRRLELAELMAARFPGEPVLDLTRLQSTTKAGAREMHVVTSASVTGARSRLVPMLWPGWSRDGGHLNAAGKRMAGRAFVRALVESHP